jgi:hypothetical protein
MKMEYYVLLMVLSTTVFSSAMENGPLTTLYKRFELRERELERDRIDRLVAEVEMRVEVLNTMVREPQLPRDERLIVAVCQRGRTACLVKAAKL